MKIANELIDSTAIILAEIDRQDFAQIQVEATILNLSKIHVGVSAGQQ